MNTKLVTHRTLLLVRLENLKVEMKETKVVADLFYIAVQIKKLKGILGIVAIV